MENPQWLLNLRWNIWWGVGYMHDLKLVTHKFLVICKRNTTNCPVEKLGKTFAGWSKWTSPRSGRWVWSTFALRNTCITFVVFWQGIRNLTLIMRKHETKTMWGSFRILADLYFQRCQYNKRQSLKYSRWKEINETWKLNATHNPGLNPGLKGKLYCKRHY